MKPVYRNVGLKRLNTGKLWTLWTMSYRTCYIFSMLNFFYLHHIAINSAQNLTHTAIWQLYYIDKAFSATSLVSIGLFNHNHGLTAHTSSHFPAKIDNLRLRDRLKARLASHRRYHPHLGRLNRETGAVMTLSRRRWRCGSDGCRLARSAALSGCSAAREPRHCIGGGSRAAPPPKITPPPPPVPRSRGSRKYRRLRIG